MRVVDGKAGDRGEEIVRVEEDVVIVDEDGHGGGEEEWGGRASASPTGENSHGSVVVTGNAGRALVTGAVYHRVRV